MNAIEAIHKAKEHLAVFRPILEGLRVEAATNKGKNKNWLVTLSFFDDDASLPSALMARRNRVHKRIEMNKDGELIGIEA
ncbi:MAG: hypothetical protein HN352_17680 [Bacteroidetes bacterium]|jgi:hypothetical protein|nr:hypothetical protein [Bacteroidota bacterium]MBT4398441.1 hypothetical protein [Bacteroidota bacterium]MBT4408847.1 hypothetical protein [Bacteroidota bacterium]MBT7092427.1 hypothetical protein [Bacteroidota bacterium]MBT7464800.1 hypothetical protein [Bacteroidota bacterium]